MNSTKKLLDIVAIAQRCSRTTVSPSRLRTPSDLKTSRQEWSYSALSTHGPLRAPGMGIRTSKPDFPLGQWAVRRVPRKLRSYVELRERFANAR